MKDPLAIFDCCICGDRCSPVDIELSLDKHCLCGDCRSQVQRWEKSVVKHC